MAESKAVKLSKRLSNPELRCKNGFVVYYCGLDFDIIDSQTTVGVDFTAMLFTWATAQNVTKN